MSELSPEAKLLVQNETRETIWKIAALFGIANVTVAGGAIFAMWSFIQSETSKMVPKATQEVISEVRKDVNSEELEELIFQISSELGGATKELEITQKNISSLSNKIAEYEDQIKAFENKNLNKEAANFLIQVSEDPDLVNKINKIGQLESEISSQKVYFSNHIFKGHNFIACNNSSTPKKALSTVIDYGFANFKQKPIVVTALSGFEASSPDSVEIEVIANNVTKTSFELVVQCEDNTKLGDVSVTWFAMESRDDTAKLKSTTKAISD